MTEPNAESIGADENAAAPPFNTGGGGFEYEDYIAAHAMAGILTELPPFGEELGTADRIDWQVDARDWQFNDLLVTCDTDRGRRIAISCKSGRYVTNKGWPAEAVEQVWKQWIHAGQNPFDQKKDILAVATGHLAQDARNKWDRLLQEALVGDSTRFMQRYQKAGSSSKVARDLVASLRCPDHLVDQISNEQQERFKLIQCLRLWHRDDLASHSAQRVQAVGWCHQALQSSDRSEAQSLHAELLRISYIRRSRGGTITRQEMVALLAPQFALKTAPSHESSWRKLDAHSAELQADIGTSLRDTLCLVRPELWSAIRNAAKPGGLLVLAGESGSGKSALAIRLCRCVERTQWLTASDLEYTTFTKVGSQLGITAALNTLVGDECSANSLLVIDGAEKLGRNGRHIAARLIDAAIHAVQPWQVVMTAQEDGVEALRLELAEISKSEEHVQTINVRLLNEDEVSGLLGPLGIGLTATKSGALVRSLRNLKVLDWLARASKIKVLESFPDLVREVWAGFLGNDDEGVHAEVLKKLGKEDATQVVGGAPSSTFPDAAEQRVLATLIQRGLISRRKQRLFFRHDLLGDWARLQILIESGENAIDTLEELSVSIRWRPAFRYFAEWLLHGDEADQERLASLLVGEPDNPNSITLLEGLFRSPECGPIVASLLEHNSWLNQDSLATLLRTFVSVATRPSDIGQLFAKEHPGSAAIRVAFRVPVHELWPGMMEALNPRAHTIAKITPINLGSVVRSWLSDDATIMRQADIETHRSCAWLAVEAARELQAVVAESPHILGAGLGIQHTFEAALFAATWFPDEVAALALELSARRPEPQAVIDRVEAEKKRSSNVTKERLAQLSPDEITRIENRLIMAPVANRRRGPIPDGPSKPVHEAFRKAVLGAGVIVRLARSRPDAAQEVLLACCLADPSMDDPKYSSVGFDDHTGTVNLIDWYPPLHLRGPWLALLTRAPDHGLDAVLRLVNVGTSEWLRLNTVSPGYKNYEEVQRKTSVTLNIEGKDRVFRGDQSVFGWYRGLGRAGNIVTSALMALEAWLYRLVEKDLPIEWVVRRVMDAGSSVALLGVLAALGRKHDRLLNGLLCSIVSCWRILAWDEQVAMQDAVQSIGLYRLPAIDNIFGKGAERWSALAHRRANLPRLIAKKLASGEVEIVKACDEARAKWAGELDAKTCLDPDKVERFIALFDPQNLAVEKLSDGQLALSITWPTELAAKDDEQGESSDPSIDALVLRKSCRAILDNARDLTDAQAESIWSQATTLTSPMQPDGNTSTVTTITARAAVAAVLENHASGWLDRFPERRSWSESAAVNATPEVRELSIETHGMSEFKEHGEAFTGAWAVARIAAGDTRKSVRRALAEAMTVNEYVVTGQVLAAGLRLAGKIPGELGRLFNLAWLWAALCNLSGDASQTDTHKVRISTARRKRLRQAFVQGRIPCDLIPWDELRLRAARVSRRAERRRLAERSAWGLVETHAEELSLPKVWGDYDDHGFNWGVLGRIAESQLIVVQTSNDLALEPLGEFDRRLVDLAVWTMKCDQRRRRGSSNSLPNMMDRIALSRAATIIAAHEDEAYAIDIWRALAPHLVHHRYWVASFFSEWFEIGRREANSTEQFYTRWRLMIEHTDELADWDARKDEGWNDVAIARSALLGIQDCGTWLVLPEDRPFIKPLVDRYAEWAKAYAGDAWRLRALCRFLQCPSADALRLPALTWVCEALMLLSDYRMADSELMVEIAEFCVTVWYQEKDRVLANRGARTSLVAIVQHLSHLRVQEILELRDDVEAAMAQAEP
ncbi:MAG: hypothetical protein DHS20C16_12360 [Phycisphaerae bacterium]|nr:MAG: hypothetical protein DHS20C16_12360 [Phycisphaerae bacterium]